MNADHIKGIATQVAARADLLILFNAPPPGCVTMLLSCAVTGDILCFGNWRAENLRNGARALAARHRAPLPPALPLPKAIRLMQRAADRARDTAGRLDAADRLEALFRKALVASMAKDPSLMPEPSTDETMCGLLAFAPWDRSPVFMSKTMRRMSLAESGWRVSDETAAPATQH